MKIYLCGGMKGTWQDQVIAALPRDEFLDPRSHGLTDEQAYTQWDLNAIDRADLVLAVMTADNPSGYGLNLEIGYAKAKGVPVYLVCEDLGNRMNYFGMARQCSRVFPDIRTAVDSIWYYHARGGMVPNER